MLFLYIVLFLILLYFILFIFQKYKCKQNKFVLYFGIPGCGKSTVASLIAHKSMKKNSYSHILSNFAITGTECLDKSDIGVYDMSNSLLIIDEAGVDFDNRNWKSNLNHNQVYFFKHHRHYNSDIFMFSQSLDIDIKLRNLANEIRIVKRSLIPFFVCTKEIRKYIDIDKDTGQIVDKYKWVLFSSKMYFMPKSWKLFNSYTRKQLDEKIFDRY